MISTGVEPSDRQIGPVWSASLRRKTGYPSPALVEADRPSPARPVCLDSMMTTDNGATARKRMLLAAVRHRRDDGGVYWTRDSENSGGRDELVKRAEGINPVSSCPRGNQLSSFLESCHSSSRPEPWPHLSAGQHFHLLRSLHTPHLRCPWVPLAVPCFDTPADVYRGGIDGPECSTTV